MVKAEKLTKIYRLFAEEIAAVDNVDLIIEQGEYVSLMGPSGSGKTTLLDMIGCLDSVTAGRLEILGSDVSTLPEKRLVKIRRGKIGFVFQDFSLVPSLTALENIELAMYFADTKNSNGYSKQLLDRVGLSARINHLPKQMSGGEKQRVAIARALAIEPEFLLADEPTGQLDSESSQEIVSLLKQLNEEDGLTIILATHDTNLGTQTKRTVYLRDGKIITDTKS